MVNRKRTIGVAAVAAQAFPMTFIAALALALALLSIPGVGQG